jgi:hypothetical protein
VVLTATAVGGLAGRCCRPGDTRQVGPQGSFVVTGAVRCCSARQWFLGCERYLISVGGWYMLAWMPVCQVPRRSLPADLRTSAGRCLVCWVHHEGGLEACMPGLITTYLSIWLLSVSSLCPLQGPQGCRCAARHVHTAAVLWAAARRPPHFLLLSCLLIHCRARKAAAALPGMSRRGCPLQRCWA